MTDIDDGTYAAVLDRFEGELAVLLLEADDDLAGELAVPTDALPADGQHVDAVFAVEVDDGDLVDADYDPDETDRRRTDAQSRFDRLSERPPSDGDDADDR